MFRLFLRLKSLPQRQFTLHVLAALRRLVQNRLGILLIFAELRKPQSTAVTLILEELPLLWVIAPSEPIINAAALLLHGLNLLLSSGNELRHLFRRLQSLTAQ